MYNYSDGTTKSYGRLMGKPVNERYWLDIQTNPVGSDPPVYPLCVSFVRSSNSAVPINGTSNGSSVGYDKVTILYGKETGVYGVNGKSEFDYKNESVTVYNYAGAREPGIFNVKNNGNGLLLFQKDYKYDNGSYQITRSIINQYATVGASSLNRPEFLQNTPTSEIIYAIRKVKLVNNTLENGFGLYYYPAMHSEWVRHMLSVTIDYDQNDISKFSSRATLNEFESIPVHFQLVSQVNASLSHSIKTSYRYPEDYNYGSTSTAIQKMVDKYQVNQPIETFQTVGTDVISATATEFTHDTSSDLIVANKMHKLKTNTPMVFSGTTNGTDFSSYEERAIYHEYDDKGNLLEVSKIDDVHTVYLWGYNQTLPIAQIVNATYADIEGIIELGSNFHGGVDGFNGNQEQSLRDGLPNSLITTYEYDPLVGIISSTDPRGLTTTYEYDDLNRLEWVIDHQDNIAKKFEYQFDNDGTQ